VRNALRMRGFEALPRRARQSGDGEAGDAHNFHLYLMIAPAHRKIGVLPAPSYFVAFSAEAVCDAVPGRGCSIVSIRPGQFD
jgi:hypothetical protein